MINEKGLRHTRRRLLGVVASLGLASSPITSRTQCLLMELRPGYPGYTGYVTGLDGIGDFACLSDLLLQNPNFDPEAEHLENLRAASQVGLEGDPRLWTWENWMLIEAQRGFSPTCYSCLILASDDRPEPRGMPVVATDPRLLLGGFGTTTALYRLATERGTDSSRLISYFKYDHYLRALVNMASPGTWNAAQLLEGYEAWIEVPTMRGSYVSPGPLWQNLVAQGGYAPTPLTAYPEDQLFTIWIGALALEILTTTEAHEMLLNRLEFAESEWKSTGLNGTFAAFLRGLGAERWLSS